MHGGQGGVKATLQILEPLFHLARLPFPFFVRSVSPPSAITMQRADQQPLSDLLPAATTTVDDGSEDEEFLPPTLVSDLVLLSRKIVMPRISES